LLRRFAAFTELADACRAWAEEAAARAGDLEAAGNAACGCGWAAGAARDGGGAVRLRVVAMERRACSPMKTSWLRPVTVAVRPPVLAPADIESAGR